MKEFKMNELYEKKLIFDSEAASIAQLLERDYIKHTNLSLNLNQIRYIKGYIEAKNTEEINFNQFNCSDSAISDLLKFLKIPIRYFKNHCDSDLRSLNFKAQAEKIDKKIILSLTEKDTIRAALSSTYSIYRHRDLFSHFKEASKDLKIKYIGMNLNEHLLQIQGVFPETKVKKENDLSYTAGFSLSNSETGKSSIIIEPIVMVNLRGIKKIIRNKAALKNEGIKYRLTHRGEITKERIEELFTQLFKISQIGIFQLLENQSKTFLEKRKTALKSSLQESLSKIQYSSYFKDLEYLNLEIVTTNEEISDYLLEVAQNMPIFKRTLLEQHAGRILGLFVATDKKMDLIQDNLNKKSITTSSQTGPFNSLNF